MKLILHIGTVKTGTTTAQAWFAQNRVALKEHGIWYPSSFPSIDKRPVGTSHPFIVDVVLAPEHFRRNALGAFRREFESMKAAGCKVCVMSFEDLEFRLSSSEMVAGLAGFLRDYFDAVEIVLYLRPQIDTVVSFASTASLLGVRIDRKWFFGQSRNHSIFNYNAAVDRWESVFSSENVRCFSYKRDLPFADYVVKQFAVDGALFKPVENRNISVGSNIIALGNVLQMPLVFTEAVVQNLPRSEPLSVGAEMARWFQSNFDESNAELVRRRDDIRMDDLEPDWRRYERPENLDAIAQECVFSAELKALFQLLTGQMCIERARNALMRAEIAKGHRQMDAVLAFANLALTEARGAMQFEAFKGEAQRIQEVATVLAASRASDVSSA